MSYNRLNFLRRVIDIQNIYLQHREHGSSGEWIYHNHIRPVYHISKSTFQRYLAINARRALRLIDEKYESNP